MTYQTPAWDAGLKNYLARAGSLAEKYKAARDLALIPCEMPDGSVVNMSAGDHSELIKDIIEQFAPRFAPGSKVLYLGDTGNKGVVHDAEPL